MKKKSEDFILSISYEAQHFPYEKRLENTLAHIFTCSGNALCKTDLQIALPDGCYGRVAPRSGLAVKHFVDVGAGVVDADYRGNLCVVLFNFGKEDFKVKRGDRIAQLICEKISYPELEEVQRLDETVRGENGFGSSGR